MWRYVFECLRLQAIFLWHWLVYGVDRSEDSGI